MSSVSLARKFMIEDNYISAIAELRRELETNATKKTISLMNLASCYYMLSDYVIFERFAKQSYDGYLQEKNILSDDEKTSAILGIAKLLEELNYVHEALLMYDSVQDYSTNIKYKKILASKLRLQIELNLKNETQMAYRSCLAFDVFDGDLEVDIINALLNYNYYYFGFKSALELYESRIYRNGTYKKSDKRLLFFNFLYQVLLSAENQNALLYLDKYLNEFDYFDCDSFEKILFDIYLEKTNNQPFNSVNLNRCGQLSLACQMRFFKMYLTLIKNKDSEKFTIKKMMLSTLSTLSKESQNLLIKNVDLEVNDEIRFILLNDKIEFNNYSLLISKNNYLILKKFSDNNLVSIEDFSMSIFNSQVDINTFDRIRMSVSRLNKSIASAFGVPKTLILTKEHIKLAPFIEVQLRNQSSY